MSRFTDILEQGDRRSIGRANEILSLVKNQNDFDELFKGLNHQNRLVVMRTADVIEKITLSKNEYLQKHKKEVLAFIQSVNNIEFKWHLALIVSRIKLNEAELGIVWHYLTEWANNKKESRIVRVNSIQGLFNLLIRYPDLKEDLKFTLAEMEKEKIPSINARIRMFNL